MKLSAQEEYGLRCLLHMGRQPKGGSLTIPEISRAEGISEPYVGKLMRILRRGGFVTSVRGQAGGYTLARPPEQIIVGQALAGLGGRLFESDFCDRHTGNVKLCTHSIDCSVRSLWRSLQLVVDQVLSQTTLKDLLGNEQEMTTMVGGLTEISASRPTQQQLS